MAALRALALLAACAAPTSAPAFPEPTGGATVLAVCKRIARKLASVSLGECLGRELVASGGVSVLGAPILMKEYPPLGRKPAQARVLLVGGIHGDEYSSVTIVFKWLRTLDKHHSGLFHWHIVPLLNPDGLLRKKSRRVNAHEVDLNRNFATPNWRQEAGRYWIRRTGRNPRRYPGPAAESEPESRWLAGEIARFQPHAIVAVHAPHGLVDFDGPPRPPRRLGRLYLRLLGTYPGSLGRFAGVHKGIPVVTIELPYAGIMPKPREVRRIWVDLVRWLRRNVPKRPRATARRAPVAR